MNDLSCLLCYETKPSLTPQTTRGPWSSSLLKLLSVNHILLDEAYFNAGLEEATYCDQCLDLVSESIATFNQIEELQRALTQSVTLIEKRIIDGYRGTKSRLQASDEEFLPNHPFTLLRNKLYEEIQYRHPEEEPLLSLSTSALTDELTYNTEAVSVKEEPENYFEFEMPSISPVPVELPTRRVKQREKDPLDLESLSSVSMDRDETDDHGNDEEWTPEFGDYESDPESYHSANSAQADVSDDEAWQTMKPSNSTLQKILTDPPSVIVERLPESSMQESASRLRSNLQGPSQTTSKEVNSSRPPKRVKKRKLFKAHKKSQKAPVPVIYKCSDCEKCYTIRKLLKNHQLSKHTFTCETCGKIFKHKGILRDHVEKMHPKVVIFTCETCSKSFPTCSRLTAHQRVHTGERPFICDICSLTFTSPQYLRSHKLNKHEGSDSFVCPECNRRFTTRAYMKRHLAIIHRGEFKLRCQICNAGMSRSIQLKLHMEVTHGERRLNCSQCDKTFASESYLVDHLKRHEKKNADQRDHVCETCGKGFIDRKYLVRHRQTHLSEKKFVCEVCGKGFTVENYLYIHMKTHNRVNEGTWGWGFKKADSSSQLKTS